MSIRRSNITLTIQLLERAVEELKRELSQVEVELAANGISGETHIKALPGLDDEHTDLAAILQDQYNSLMKILGETMAEMERLKRTSPSACQ